jgi:hypothetical protein
MPGDCQSYSEKGGIKPGIGSIQFKREKGKEALPRTFNVSPVQHARLQVLK